MARDLTPAAEAAVTAETVTRCVAVALDFASGTVRLTGAPFDITIDGDAFLGVGALGAIAAVEESAEIGSTTLALTLGGVPRDMIAVALGEPYQNRPATVWEVPLDPATLLPIADPIIIFRGRMDVMTVSAGAATAEVRLTLTNRLVDWERPRRILFSDEEQRRLHPGDTAFRYAAAMEEKDVVWPTGQWFRVFAT